MMTTHNYTADIYDIAVETFELMCYMFPLDESEVPDKQVKPEQCTTSVAHFEGAANGGMAICATPNLLDALAENMLGTEDATREQKEGALCEMVNIVCGNVAPFFSKDNEICYIRPPRITGPGEKAEELFPEMKSETVPLHLDEGSAVITVYYS